MNADKGQKIPTDTDLSTMTSTTHFRMRPVELEDTTTVADWYQQIEDVSIFDRQTPLPLNRSDVKKIIESIVSNQESKQCNWFITETLEGQPVGMTGLESINSLHGHAILPLFVAQPWRRSGVGIRMVCLMLDLAFKQLRLHRVGTLYRADNAATGNMVQKLGFTVEGTSRQSWFAKGQYFDVVNVGILVDEWTNRRVQLNGELGGGTIVELGPRPSSAWSWPYSNAVD